MKYSEFRKWLKKQGATFKKHRSGSSHYRVTLNGKTTIFPDHGAKEMGTHLVAAIRRRLVSNEQERLTASPDTRGLCVFLEAVPLENRNVVVPHRADAGF